MAAPKLLDKKLLNVAVAAERRQQVETGIALAKKVDAVRESLQTEEKNLETFRDVTVKKVQVEIDGYIKQKDLAQAEIERLNRDIELLQMRKSQELMELPPNEQWEKTEAIFAKYDEDMKNLESARQLVAQQIGDNTLKAHELEIERGRIEEMKHLTSENLANADAMYQEAKESAADMRNRAQVVLSAAELREKVVVYKERDIETREANTEKENLRLKELETDLNKREQVLKDRYATLERTLKRIKK